MGLEVKKFNFVSSISVVPFSFNLCVTSSQNEKFYVAAVFIITLI